MNFTYLLSLVLIFLSLTTKLFAQDQNQANFWEQKLVESSGWNNKKTVEELSLGLIKMGNQREKFAKSSDVDAIYEKLQLKILSIPEHAKLLADEYEIIRKENSSRSRFSRYWYLMGRFRHLPSPQSVTVIGDYLEFFIDSTQPELPLDQISMPRAYKEGDEEIAIALPLQATYTLVLMGLRDMPIRIDELKLDLSSAELTEQWKKTRAWYQDVKSGKRTFSFRGQSVEYRFKPDGTWDTIPLQNPPDDASVYPIATKEQLAKLYAKPVYVPPPTPAIPKKPEENRWGWIVGVIVILFAISFWIGAKKRKQA